MCPNVSCTWPFDSDDMGQYFAHDSATSSLRKRAKKRKASTVTGKEERRHSKKHIKPVLGKSATATASGQVSAAVGWSSGLYTAGSGRATLLDSSLRSASTGLTQGNYHGVNSRESEVGVRAGASVSYAAGSSQQLASNIMSESPGWLDELMSGLSNTANGADRQSNNDVVDIFAALNSVGRSNTDDAVIPRSSRQPSPTTSNESGADDIDAHGPLTPSELATLLGNNKDISDMLSATPSFDPLSVLMTPTTAALPSAGSNMAEQLDLDSLWKSAETGPGSIVPSGGSFDLSNIFDLSSPPSADVNAAKPSFDTSLLDNLFASASSPSPSSAL
ncbi:hypothetical protein FBU59_001582 [Linderina macrospora]|uniref:Uncharacterized protein n=1 Tax=Linderina macrospora TaxID=4868 RepID=A0ACC1JDM7_9FUNG|nr:hypothetical protein FBU59_001582 [Linderina macrospora]